MQEILARHGRAGDYVEISLESEYRYNPLHNDLDAHALTYNIASLLNNLFGWGKEPFWQQAYTNLVTFIILLHKVAFDYVTIFDVYECAISPEVLEKRIDEAEEKLPKFFVEVTPGNLPRQAKQCILRRGHHRTVQHAAKQEGPIPLQFRFIQ